MHDRHPVRLDLVHMLPAFLQQRGLSLQPALARAGIDPADDWTSRVVTRAQVCALLRDIARRTGEPAAGLDLATHADPARLGVSGRALFAGDTLRQCLRGHRRHLPSLQSGVALGLAVQGGRAHWHHQHLDSDHNDAQVLNEGIAAFMTTAIRAIAGAAPLDLHVTFPHRARAAASLYQERLQADVGFAQGGGIGISFDAALLDRRNSLLSGNDLAAAVITGDEALPAIVPGDGALSDEALLRSLRHMIEALLLAGTLSLLEAARTLGYAPRSLQRQLARCGTSFEALLDERRRGLARAYLAEASVPVQSIALALGYSHPAHFVRAFRRWEGMTPLVFRRGLWREMAMEPARPAG